MVRFLLILLLAFIQGNAYALHPRVVESRAERIVNFLKDPHKNSGQIISILKNGTSRPDALAILEKLTDQQSYQLFSIPDVKQIESLLIETWEDRVAEVQEEQRTKGKFKLYGQRFTSISFLNYPEQISAKQLEDMLSSGKVQSIVFGNQQFDDEIYRVLGDATLPLGTFKGEQLKLSVLEENVDRDSISELKRKGCRLHFTLRSDSTADNRKNKKCLNPGWFVLPLAAAVAGLYACY